MMLRGGDDRALLVLVTAAREYPAFSTGSADFQQQQRVDPNCSPLPSSSEPEPAARGQARASVETKLCKRVHRPA